MLTEDEYNRIVAAAGSRQDGVRACLNRLGLVPASLSTPEPDPEPDPEPSPSPDPVGTDTVPVDRAGRPMIDEDGNEIPIEER